MRKFFASCMFLGTMLSDLVHGVSKAVCLGSCVVLALSSKQVFNSYAWSEWAIDIAIAAGGVYLVTAFLTWVFFLTMSVIVMTLGEKGCN